MLFDIIKENKSKLNAYHTPDSLPSALDLSKAGQFDFDLKLKVKRGASLG